MFSTSFSQGSAGDEAEYEYRYLIDMPTAGMLHKGFVGVTSDILPNGVLIAAIEAGVFENVSFGISFGGSNFLGSGNVDWYKWPGINIKLRILDEAVLLPAITLGFDTQGKGEYVDSSSRYTIKSPGIFAAVRKNFDFIGYLSFHGSVNYSLEGNDGDNFVNLKVGAEKTFGSNFSLIIEYDFAFNDNNSPGFGENKGYLNIGLRWTVSEGFTIGFDLRDLRSNKSNTRNSFDRAMRIEYIQSIF
ncbi:MAG: hypothetical protein HKM87_07090 [Ignavibacteriaceae bacterium]|nr:hypothetical protein [Ignavibacteriaceae bacterium]